MIIADPGLANCRMINDWTNLPNYMQIQIRLLTFEFEALTNEQLMLQGAGCPNKFWNGKKGEKNRQCLFTF